jgi:hypothetical protein
MLRATASSIVVKQPVGGSLTVLAATTHVAPVARFVLRLILFKRLKGDTDGGGQSISRPYVNAKCSTTHNDSQLLDVLTQNNTAFATNPSFVSNDSIDV